MKKILWWKYVDHRDFRGAIRARPAIGQMWPCRMTPRWPAMWRHTSITEQGFRKALLLCYASLVFWSRRYPLMVKLKETPYAGFRRILSLNSQRIQAGYHWICWLADALFLLVFEPKFFDENLHRRIKKYVRIPVSGNPLSLPTSIRHTSMCIIGANFHSCAIFALSS